jgi:hypothetical protein
MSLKVIVSDLQVPFHHRRAVASLCGFLADRESDIEEVHQIGDFYDFTAISRWVKGTAAEDGRTLQKELDAGRLLLEDFSKAYAGRKTLVRGNHDDRIDTYLTKAAPGLKGLDALGFGSITGLSEYGWSVESQPYRLAANTSAVHGLTVRARSGYTPHAHMERLPGNIVHGHTHRAGLVFRTLGDDTRWAMETGCLMERRQASYLACGLADWQLAFGVLDIDGNNVQPHLVMVSGKGEFTFQGKRYKP